MIDLTTAKLDDYIRAVIDGETLRFKVVETSENVIGSIGFLEVNFTLLQKEIEEGGLHHPERWKILEVLPKNHDYSDFNVIVDIKKYVHEIKIGDKLVCVVIDYRSKTKMWYGMVYNFYPNPAVLKMGGQHESLQHYIKYIEDELNEDHRKFSYGFINRKK